MSVSKIRPSFVEHPYKVSCKRLRAGYRDCAWKRVQLPVARQAKERAKRTLSWAPFAQGSVGSLGVQVFSRGPKLIPEYSCREQKSDHHNSNLEQPSWLYKDSYQGGTWNQQREHRPATNTILRPVKT